MGDSVTYLPFGEGRLLPVQPDRPGPDGAAPWFERDPEPVGRLPNVDDVVRVTARVEESLDRIREFGALAMERLSDLPHPPDTLSVQIAVKVSAEAGVVVAKSTAEANFTVTMEWHRPEPPAVTESGTGSG